MVLRYAADSLRGLQHDWVMRILAVVVGALALAPAAFAGPSLRVGVVEDSAIWNEPALHTTRGIIPIVSIYNVDAAGNVGRETVSVTATRGSSRQ